MSVEILRLTPRDPIIARDGRPFGRNQGNRMRGVPWPLPSVVAGSFRTALVKASETLAFDGNMPGKLLSLEVAGAFPSCGNQLYVPAPFDAVAEPANDGSIKRVHCATPQQFDGGCDFPDGVPLQPVMLSEQQSASDFKPAPVPAWWPIGKVAEWLLGRTVAFDNTFLDAPIQEIRDHVVIDETTGAHKDGEIFSTTGLQVGHLPRFGIAASAPFQDQFAEVSLSVRVGTSGNEFEHVKNLNLWHPLGGERRLVHWATHAKATLWECPERIASALSEVPKVRMVLATPAIFSEGWKPGWLDSNLEGVPPGSDVKLKLVGVCNGRWKAVSGWSLAKVNANGELDPHNPHAKPGPKAIRRMAPAGSVYFFMVVERPTKPMKDLWLRPVSDSQQDRNDGFGLAVWGTW